MYKKEMLLLFYLRGRQKRIFSEVYTVQKIQNGAVAKSYRTNGLLIYGEIFAHFPIY